MTDRTELHEDDVETVARHMWEVEEVSRDREQRFPIFDEDGMPALCFDDMTDEDRSNWLRWARGACAGAAAFACGVGVVAWTAARGMARVLAERRAEIDGWRDLVVLLDGRPHERATREDVERARKRLHELGLNSYTGERAAEKSR